MYLCGVNWCFPAVPGLRRIGGKAGLCGFITKKSTLKMGIQKIAKEVILDEIAENAHPEKVEDVIFWALKYYADNYPDPTWGKTIAKAIVSRINEEESKYESLNN